MINFRFAIENPWAKSDFKNIYVVDGPFFTKHKGWEFEIIKYSRDLFKIHFAFTLRGCDHPGLKMTLALLGYSASLHIYDGRHWDYENNCWEKYTD